MKTPTQSASPLDTDLTAGMGSLDTDPLVRTDPEFVEFFNNFAFTDVPAESALQPTTRLMLQLAAVIAAPALNEFTSLAGVALASGVTPVEIKEITYQAVPYIGVAKARDFIIAANEVFTRHGIALPLPSQSTTTPQTRAAAGLAVQTRIVGEARKSAMAAAAPADQQHIQRFLEANCFGDYYTRSGIDIPMRELLTFATLVSLGGADPQVAGHVAANLNVGNTRAMLVDTLT